MNDDLISRVAAIEAMEDVDWYHINNDGQLIHGANSEGDEPLYKAEDVYKVLNDMPSAQPTLYGYPVEHLAMIARVLQKENLPPERVAEMLSDVGHIVEMARDEFEETLRKAVEGCVI